MSVFRILPAILLAAAFCLSPVTAVPPAHAAGSSEPAAPAKPVDPNFIEGRKAIDAKNFSAAIPLFQAVVSKDGQNADAYNWLGYAYRNLGNYEQSFASYTKALQIDPRHRGAHEYIGEAYLKTNRLEKAEEHLKRLDSLCLFGCAEYTELKTKIAAYKAGKLS